MFTKTMAAAAFAALAFVPIGAAVVLSQAADAAPCAFAYACDGSGVQRVQEDDPGWDCITMGDRSCGPTNSNGFVAGCYDDTGAMVAAWPCHVVVNPDGSSDVYTPDER